MKKLGWIILIICGVASAIFIAVVAINILFGEKEEYRVIKISEHQGEIVLEHDDEEIYLDEENSFSGMNLKSQDAVTTKEEAFMVLMVDSDKHIYADENTRFSIVATGDAEKGSVKINLEYGSALCELENKLSEEAVFEVETPNATAAVRGTTFGVYYDEESNETKVEVLDGTVEVKTPTETQKVEAGGALLISGNEGIISPDIEVGEFEEEDAFGEFNNIVAIMENAVAARIPADNAIKGDPILDDSTEREYIVVYSGAAMMFGNGEGVFIFESGNGASPKEMKMISQELSDKFNAIYGNVNINGNSVKIAYQQIPDFAMETVKEFCVGSDDYMRSITFEALGVDGTQQSEESSAIMEGIMKYVFDFKMVESTPYDFYDGLGLIE